MGFVIASDSRKRDEVLYMVDRRKQKASFWSNRLEDVFVYQLRPEAEAKANSLRFNNARVMTLSEARRFDDERMREEEHHGAMNTMESGWDGHKVWF